MKTLEFGTFTNTLPQRMHHGAGALEITPIPEV
jgi:hypothetical protein